MAVQRRNPSPVEILKSDRGFALILCLSILPVILAASFAFLFSSYLTKNWMQSLHTCRTELLHAQSEAAKDLQVLLALNKTVMGLRLSLVQAKTELAAAMASDNPALAAHAASLIAKIRYEQKHLDQLQRTLIYDANFHMNIGLSRAMVRLQMQNMENLRRASSLFHFQVESIHSTPQSLAVRPDIPDIAPVYELKTDFTQQQALSVFWNSTFHTDSSKGFQWIQNHHSKRDFCSASLQNKDGNFQEVLTEDKLSSKL